jgi:predicted DNA-binding helix-hairpin-helix protein
MMDCAYCPNSIYVPRKRFAFKVEELAGIFMELHQRHTVEGLFLSSGIAGSGSKTTERMIHVAEALRRNYGFTGYIHLKVMPGTEEQFVEAAHRMGTRLSINVETPTVEGMRKLSSRKDLERDILTPIGWIDGLIGGEEAGAVGQVTQLVVGAADESDQEIFQRVTQLYSQRNMKRVYYSAFRPARFTPLEEHPPTPMVREHRLYQLDWLKRIYGFPDQELEQAFVEGGFLPYDYDPKTVIAYRNLDAFPVDVNAATREQLLHVPGVGPTAAQRILGVRRGHRVDTWRDLEAMGVVKRRASPFLVFPGQRPAPSRQLQLQLFEEAAPPAPSALDLASSQENHAPCGLAQSCAGCGLYGTPGHPGSSSFQGGQLDRTPALSPPASHELALPSPA